MKKSLFLIIFLLFSTIHSQVRKGILILMDDMNQIFAKLPFDHFSVEDIKEIDRLQKLMQQFQLKVKDDELIYIYKNEFKSRIKNVVLTEIYKRKNIDKIKLFKETVHQKDELSLSENDTYSIQSIFFDAITDDECDIELINDLVNYIFEANPLNISLIENITHKIPINQSYYDKVRKLTVEYKSKYLLSYIARFKNSNDIELIKSYGTDSYFAIKEFPSEEFIPFLESMAEKESRDYEYLSTVAKFCNNKKSAQLIDNVFKILKKNNYNVGLFEHYISSDNKCLIKQKSGENSPLDYY